MSAFVVGHDHIDALLSFATRRTRYGSTASFSHELGDAFERRAITEENATEIGRILLAENERSVGARYPDCKDNPEDMPGTIGETAASYRFKAWSASSPLTATAILKGCSCFDYQACETADYETTRAHAIIDGIRHHAIHMLPGYDDCAGWEFRRPKLDRVA
jgi:hypothetical protein